MSDRLPAKLSKRARTVVACLAIRQRARAVSYFIDQYQRGGERHDLAAAELHARQLRERAQLAHREATLDSLGIQATGGDANARRMG